MYKYILGSKLAFFKKLRVNNTLFNFNIYLLSQKTLLLIACAVCMNTFAQKKFTVVIDPGHGKNSGAVRKYNSIGIVREDNIVLAVGLKLGKLLEKNNDITVLFTRKTDELPSLIDRTNLANRNNADLFVSIHCNSSSKANSTSYGTETFVQGPDQNDENLEVAKLENSVIYLDENDKQNFASYDPNSLESLIALKIQQSRYLESSLMIGSMVEENFVKKNKRFSRGVKQANLHVLRLNAMPSILIETGFINHYPEAQYLISEKGQNEIAQSIYDAIIRYKQVIDRNKINENNNIEKTNNETTADNIKKSESVSTKLENRDIADKNTNIQSTGSNDGSTNTKANISSEKRKIVE